MMRTEGSLRRKIWKPFDWILLWLEKYWQTSINSAAGIYGILVLDDKNNYESQRSDRLVLVDIYCRITIWNT